ncbi:hypothetical protein OSB04_022098 [Centaurea solstitialis]|uniref:Cysteine-rich receptor-like protein kinase 2 n=1 Tax=Centaurea solstitialis TaxID=347529 RepID=A0AA38SVG5_9ASTR|nr:hypothetical protein OSB04_022098 [Centaurea solstitialis]
MVLYRVFKVEYLEVVWPLGKKSSQIPSISINLFILLLLLLLIVVPKSKGDPRSQILNLTCSHQTMTNQNTSIPNFLETMTKIGTQLRSSLTGTAVTGTGPGSIYGLAECYGDLSNEDCVLCYAEARTVLPSCFPDNGGRIFLDGCFMRIQNYSFSEEFEGPEDAVYCGRTTVGGGFEDTVRNAVSNAVMDAPRNSDYFAQESAVSGTANESVYVLADCWNTLSDNSCTECLERASASILGCLPSSEGRALYTGCFLRYSNVNFINSEPTVENNGVSVFIFLTLFLLVINGSDWNAKSQIVQLICQNQQATNRTRFMTNFLQAVMGINTKMQTSHNATLVAGTGPGSLYVLAHCYADLSPRECILCCAQARTSLPSCLPNNGGRVYLEGCFMRFENYSFFGENFGREDRIRCMNTTRRNQEFEELATNAVSEAVETAPRTPNRHAGTRAVVSGVGNRSAYATADCWSSLDAEACGRCLQNASRTMLGCLPGSSGYALYTGCFMRYSDTNFTSPDENTSRATGGSGGSRRKIIAIVMGVSSVVAFVAVGIIVFYTKKHKSKSKRSQGSDDSKLLESLNSRSLNFKYSMIEKATSSFNEANKLGQGGFGTVYKGVLPNGREIAAKRLFSNHQHRPGDFYNEVNIISSVEHKNLVKLLGFSCMGPESILIYEYLPNRSLDHFIFDAFRGKELNWSKRFDIIVGTAEGLAYLHENSKTRIIHRDIKAANILLDSKLRAKIADFGLARSFQQDKNHISTGIAGTLGYMAPEYIGHGQLTEKADVYSYGVLLLEVVTGMPNRGTQTEEYTHNLVTLVWKHFKEGTVEEVFDPNMMLRDDNVKKEVEKVVQIGLLCTQEVPSLRPTMSMAIQMLSKNIHPLPLPETLHFYPKPQMIPIHFESSDGR